MTEAEYIPPTDEEIARVEAFWETVHRTVITGKQNVKDHVPFALIDKVNKHKKRLQDLECEHPEFSISMDTGFTCTQCNQPLLMLSPLQIEERYGHER